MKLSYRGVSYDYTPPQVETSNSNTVGKYRGLDVRFRNPVKLPTLQTTLDLLYRGVAYTNTPVEAAPVVTAPVSAPAAVKAEVNPVKAVVLSLEEKARSLMMNHHRDIKHRQQVMLSRLDAEVGLTAKDASGYWNHIQGKVHPSFRATYDRSHAALS